MAWIAHSKQSNTCEQGGDGRGHDDVGERHRLHDRVDHFTVRRRGAHEHRWAGTGLVADGDEENVGPRLRHRQADPATRAAGPVSRGGRLWTGQARAPSSARPRAERHERRVVLGTAVEPLARDRPIGDGAGPVVPVQVPGGHDNRRARPKGRGAPLGRRSGLAQQERRRRPEPDRPQDRLPQRRQLRGCSELAELGPRGGAFVGCVASRASARSVTAPAGS